MEGATGCLRAARFARNFFEKSFESLPRMIQSSTRLGGGHFFFETAELVVALGSSGGPSFVSSRALRAQDRALRARKGA